jgi:hypothetical protein
MSIERNRSSEPVDATSRSHPLARRAPGDQRQPPSPENVDQFRSVLEQAREGVREQVGGGDSGHQGLQAQAHAQQRAADAQLAEQAADDGLARAQVESDGIKDAARRRADELGLSASSLPPADAASLFQAQRMLHEGAQPAQAPPTANPQALVELIERHVRQLAVGDAATRDGDGRVLLRMADSTLPGTDLLLSRNGDGWTLRADVRSRSSFDAIRGAAPELAKRFAERNLGTLEIDPHFHG